MDYHNYTQVPNILKSNDNDGDSLLASSSPSPQILYVAESKQSFSMYNLYILFYTNVAIEYGHSVLFMCSDHSTNVST